MSVKSTLIQLMHGIDYTILPSAVSIEINDVVLEDVSSDSRQCNEGTLFVAVVGSTVDGHSFIEKSIQQGSPVVVVQKGVAQPEQYQHSQALILEVDETSTSYPKIVANLYQNPAKKLQFIGVTGTNGKTTITYLVEDMLSRLGFQVGVIGTVNNRYLDKEGKQRIYPTSLTTPDAKIMQRLFQEMLENGVSHVIMEVSSHAIAQARITGIEYDVAAFTNLTRDHLDYHGDMEDYFAAKSLLFTKYLKDEGVAIIPADIEQLEDGYLEKLDSVVSERKVVRWGLASAAEVNLKEFDVKLSGTDYQVVCDQADELVLSTNLVGRFNIDNLLVTLAICKGLGISNKELKDNIVQIKGAPGRIERILDGHRLPEKQPVVFVDYAHTPDALEKLLKTLKSIPHGEIIAVYGCGGDRDNGKRPVMGSVGAHLADVVIITNDNPRTEDPERILTQVTQGVKDSGMAIYDASWLETRAKGDRGCIVVSNRRDAIRAAVKLAGVKDIVAIAGKGHESYQLGAEGKKFFDDRLEVLDALSAWTVDRVVEAVGGELYGAGGANELLADVITDSRKVGNSDIFVALRGENHDAHSYLTQACEAGAGCLVVEEPADVSCPQVVVKDTTVALGNLANYRRWQFSSKRDGVAPKIIGLTGSSGKTTTKEMVATILSHVWPKGEEYPGNTVLKTQGNFNNLIGLPLSLLPLSVHHRAAVLEMGMNAPGEIAKLTKIAEPDVCCILNAQGAHLEGLGSIDGVARAKGELFENADESSVLVVNLDDNRVREIAEKYNQQKITFSLKESVGDLEADIWASHINSPRFGVIEYVLHLKGKEYEVVLHTLGEHNVANSLAAAAISSVVGASPENIVTGLASYRSPEKRMECISTDKGWSLISDCYNANPASMVAALQALATAEGKKIALLGDMFELGSGAVDAHEQIGKVAADLSIDLLLVTGEYANYVKKSAIASGLNEEQVVAFDDKDSLHKYLSQSALDNELERGDVLLVKGSRGMKMETVIPFFIN